MRSVDELARKMVKRGLRRAWLDEHADRTSYCRHRYSGKTMDTARKNARIRLLWDALEEAELVRRRVEPDDCCWEDIAGDCFKVGLHADTVPGGARTIKAQEKREWERVQRDGVWRIVTEYRLPGLGDWGIGGGLGCIVGDDVELLWDWDGYGLDLRHECIEALRSALKSRCPCCRRAA